MAAETFTWVPDFGGGTETAPSVSEVKFGDGYGQSIPAGINNMPKVRSLTFGNRETAEVDAIEAFLERQGGVRWFWYVHPGKVAIKVKCKKWSRTESAFNVETLSCSFEQVFSPGA